MIFGVCKQFVKQFCQRMGNVNNLGRESGGFAAYANRYNGDI